MSATGYCVRCRKSQEIQNPQTVTMKNGRPATKGSCPDCSGTLYRIGKAS